MKYMSLANCHFAQGARSKLMKIWRRERDRGANEIKDVGMG